MINQFVLHFTGGHCPASEYGNVFILSSGITAPLELSDMPKVAQAIYARGKRNFTIIALADDGYKGVAMSDAWDFVSDRYVPHSPVWETLTVAQVEELIGEPLDVER